MKGARGLLISITGGNDLTLYEVDEAASRIRQEVDEDANIILGATFDSSARRHRPRLGRRDRHRPGCDHRAGLSVAEARVTGGRAPARPLAIAAERPKPVLVVELTPAPAPAAAAPTISRARRRRLPPRRFTSPTKRRRLAIMPSRNIRSRSIRSPRASGRRMNGRTSRRLYRTGRASRLPSRRAASPTRTGRPEGFPPRKTSGSPVRMRRPAPEQPTRAARMPQIEDFPRPCQEQLRQARGEIGQPISAASRSSSASPLLGLAARRTRYSRSRRSLSRSANTRRSRPALVRARRYAKRPSVGGAPQAPQPSLDQHGRRFSSAASRRIIWKSRPFCGVRAITNFECR